MSPATGVGFAGYELRHLAAHLLEAGRPNDLFRLLDTETDQGRSLWFEARLTVDPSGTEYAADVAGAWTAAEAVDSELVRAGQEANLLGRELRCALMTASVRNLSENIPESLLIGLVASGLWEPRAALQAALVNDVPGRWNGSAVFVGLAPYLDEPLLELAISGARRIEESGYFLSEVLGALSRQLPGPRRSEVQQEAVTVARAIPHDRDRDLALTRLVKHLSEPWLGEVLRELVTRQYPDQYEYDTFKATNLTALAPHLPEPLAREAVQIAFALDRDELRAPLLTALAPKLRGPLRRESVRRAVRSARRVFQNERMFRDEQRCKAIADVVQLTRYRKRTRLLDEALRTAREIKYAEPKSEALGALVPHLPEPLQREVLLEALAAAQRAQADRKPWLSYSKPSPLATLLTSLASSGHPSELLAAAGLIRGHMDRSRALAALVPHLPEPLRGQALQQALEAARAIEHRPLRIAEMASVATQMPVPSRDEILREALQDVQQIRDGWDISRTLAVLAVEWKEPMRSAALREALANALAIPISARRSEALAAFAPFLPEALWEEALAAAWELHKNGAGNEALAAIGQRLAELGHPAEAIAAARAVDEAEASAAARANDDDEVSWSNALSTVAPRLAQQGYPAAALAAARLISDKWSRARVLVGLAPFLPEASLEQLLADVRANDDESIQSRMIWKMAPNLPPALLEDALSVALAMNSDEERSFSLIALAEQLSPHRGDVAHQALEASRAIASDDARSGALARVASLLADPLKSEAAGEALKSSRLVVDEFNGPGALVDLARDLAEPLRGEVLREALRRARARKTAWSRSESLKSVAQLLPDPLRGEVLRESLECARAMDEERGRASALASLAIVMPEPLKLATFHEALVNVQRITDPVAKAGALAALATTLPESLLEGALSEALTIRNQKYRREALAALAPRLARLPRSMLHTLWCQTLRARVPRSRSGLFSDVEALRTIAESVGGAGALAETVQAVRDVCRLWP